MHASLSYNPRINEFGNESSDSAPYFLLCKISILVEDKMKLSGTEQKETIGDRTTLNNVLANLVAYLTQR
jgi:hypothetical protein